MNKKIMVVLLAGALLAGCSTDTTTQTEANTDTQSEATTEAVTETEEVTDDVNESENSETESETETESEFSEIDDSEGQTGQDSESLPEGLALDLQAAADVLLAEYPEAEITQVDLDNENGTWEYEIDAQTADQEIEMTIDANTGEVRENNAEANDGEDDGVIDIALVISVDEAVEIAKAEGITAIDDMSLDNENGTVYWSVDDMDSEGEILIDAVSGQVMAREDMGQTIDDVDDQNDDMDDQNDIDDTDDQDDMDDTDDQDDGDNN